MQFPSNQPMSFDHGHHRPTGMTGLQQMPAVFAASMAPASQISPEVCNHLLMHVAPLLSNEERHIATLQNAPGGVADGLRQLGVGVTEYSLPVHENATEVLHQMTEHLDDRRCTEAAVLLDTAPHVIPLVNSRHEWHAILPDGISMKTLGEMATELLNPWRPEGNVSSLTLLTLVPPSVVSARQPGSVVMADIESPDAKAKLRDLCVSSGARKRELAHYFGNDEKSHPDQLKDACATCNQLPISRICMGGSHVLHAYDNVRLENGAIVPTIYRRVDPFTAALQDWRMAIGGEKDEQTILDEMAFGARISNITKGSGSEHFENLRQRRNIYQGKLKTQMIAMGYPDKSESLDTFVGDCKKGLHRAFPAIDYSSGFAVYEMTPPVAAHPSAGALGQNPPPSTRWVLLKESGMGHVTAVRVFDSPPSNRDVEKAVNKVKGFEQASITGRAKQARSRSRPGAGREIALQNRLHASALNDPSAPFNPGHPPQTGMAGLHQMPSAVAAVPPPLPMSRDGVTANVCNHLLLYVAPEFIFDDRHVVTLQNAAGGIADGLRQLGIWVVEHPLPVHGNAADVLEDMAGRLAASGCTEAALLFDRAPYALPLAKAENGWHVIPPDGGDMKTLGETASELLNPWQQEGAVSSLTLLTLASPQTLARQQSGRERTGMEAQEQALQSVPLVDRNLQIATPETRVVVDIDGADVTQKFQDFWYRTNRRLKELAHYFGDDSKNYASELRNVCEQCNGLPVSRTFTLGNYALHAYDAVRLRNGKVVPTIYRLINPRTSELLDIRMAIEGWKDENTLAAEMMDSVNRSSSAKGSSEYFEGITQRRNFYTKLKEKLQPMGYDKPESLETLVEDCRKGQRLAFRATDQESGFTVYQMTPPAAQGQASSNPAQNQPSATRCVLLRESSAGKITSIRVFDDSPSNEDVRKTIKHSLAMETRSRNHKANKQAGRLMALRTQSNTPEPGGPAS